MRTIFIEIPATKKSMSMRKPVFGFGINDADYKTTYQNASSNQEMCPYYRRWTNVLERCYSKKLQEKFPTYIGCSVCDEWLIFSNFKRWMLTQDWQGKEIDKDCIKPGNKIYSPGTCCFIPKSLNLILTNSGGNGGKALRGVTWHKATNKFMAQVSYNGNRIYLGVYNVEIEAREAYAKAKSEIIIEAANEQTDKRISSGLLLHADLLKRSN